MKITDNNEIYASCWGGVYRSVDLGQTWDFLDSGLPFTNIEKLVLGENNYLYAITTNHLYKSAEPVGQPDQPIFVSAPALTLYPNPATDRITINTKIQNDRGTAVIINAMGQTVWKQKQKMPSTISVQDLKNGFYILQYTNNKDSYSKTFLKQ